MAWKVKVDIDTSRIVTYIKAGIDKAHQELIPILTNYAKQNHRYQNKTGNLTNSTVVRNVRQGLEIYSTSHYAEYVHEGHGTWEPDKWLEEAIKNNEKLILDTYDKYISEELRRM